WFGLLESGCDGPTAPWKYVYYRCRGRRCQPSATESAVQLAIARRALFRFNGRRNWDPRPRANTRHPLEPNAFVMATADFPEDAAPPGLHRFHHGTDWACASDLLQQGVDQQRAAAWNGSGEFWATTDHG